MTRPTALRPALALTLGLGLAACSGSGSGATAEAAAQLGQPGQLADLRVQGLRYTSGSLSGRTDADGRFRYLPGQPVSFSLGSTVLGSAQGRSALSLFDLTGAPMPTANQQIARALRQDPAYRRLANANQLLQAFDQDGRADNGVQLTDEVAALFDCTPIDLEQDVELFQHDAILRSRLALANERELLGEPRMLPGTIAALGRLYQSMYVDGAGFAPSRIARDTDVDGSLDDSTERYYDAAGELSLCLHDTDGDGQPELVTERSTEQGSTGSLTRVATRLGLEAPPTTVLQVASDARGNAFAMKDSNADGKIDETRATLADERGRVVLEVLARQNGTDSLTLTLYGPNGRVAERAGYESDATLLAQLEGLDFSLAPARIAADIRALAAPDSLRTFRYDGMGREIEQAYDRDGDGRPDSYVYQSYDSNGNLAERALDNDADGQTDVLTRKFYDGAGNQIRSETDADGDGDLDIVSWTEFDSDGNQTRHLRDDGADGSADEVTSWEYDVHGNPVTRRNDHDGNGVNDSISHTYWVPGVWNSELVHPLEVSSCLELH